MTYAIYLLTASLFSKLSWGDIISWYIPQQQVKYSLLSMTDMRTLEANRSIQYPPVLSYVSRVARCSLYSCEHEGSTVQCSPKSHGLSVLSEVTHGWITNLRVGRWLSGDSLVPTQCMNPVLTVAHFTKRFYSSSVSQCQGFSISEAAQELSYKSWLIDVTLISLLTSKIPGAIAKQELREK